MPPERTKPRMSKKAVALLAVASLIALTVFIRHDRQEVQRIHAENLLKAEQFTREFVRDVKIGTTLEAVEEYLRTKHVKFERSHEVDNERTFVKELRIEVANERSPVWGCGRYSVGLFAMFVDERLTTARVTEWSFDCV
ncbi:MAG: hypothetical protein WC815_11970 [Vicinamibacterales bacterium]|jgi:hypothetical protein